MTARWMIVALALAAGTAACSDHEFHPPSEEARAAQADTQFSAQLFDTLTWSSDSARIATGNLVFADECRRCHGPLGRGGTDYARERDLTVPSLVEDDWHYADHPDSVRHAVFVGHGDMPEWGLGRLTPRQIDAVTAYLLQQLRPEVQTERPEIPSG